VRISVIVPCFEDRLVSDAVASVNEREPVEIIVVDDGSTDAGARAALAGVEEAGMARVIRQAHLGVAAARMTGLAAVGGRYVFMLDADDLAIPGVLAAMADLLDADPGAAAVVGDLHEFGEHELLRAVPERLDPYRVAFTNEYPASALYRRSVLEAVGGWRCPSPGLQGYDDWNLWIALAEHGERIRHLGPGRPGYRHRLHGPRLNTWTKGRHRILYRALVAAHPALFAQLPAHRRRSDLSRARRVLYPVVYGSTTAWPLDRQLKRLADRTGFWTGASRPTGSLWD
jgi:glycosyltransferase involved in cell wall biosynthesis